MFDIGLLELLIVTVVALVVLGPDKIPGAVRSGAKTIFWFKKQAADAKKETKRRKFRQGKTHFEEEHALGFSIHMPSEHIPALFR